jgi:hypothetical protein
MNQKIGKNLAKKNALFIIALNGNCRNKQFAIVAFLRQ